MEHSKSHKLGTFQWPLNKDVSLLTTKLGTFQGPPSLEPSIGHQVCRNPNFGLAIKIKACKGVSQE
jgi:hypothetical protein